MTLSVPLSPEAETRLKERARAAGVDEAAYAAQLLEEKLREAQSLTEISGESEQRFLDSGMTDDELAEQLEQEGHAARGIPYEK
jgi:hypothetical protein